MPKKNYAERFKYAFDPGSWSRGKALFHQDKVVTQTVKQELYGFKARVHSASGFNPIYDVEAILELEEDFVDVNTVCTCPVRFNCKHGVAALFMYYQLNPMPDQASDEKVEQWLQTMALVKPNPAHGLIYLLDYEKFRDQQRLCVELSKSRRLKRGGWSKSGQQYRTDSWGSDDFMTLEDKKLCAEMEAEERFGGKQIHSADLLRRVVETGRAYWSKISEQPLCWGNKQPAEWEWREQEKGLYNLVMVTQLNKDCVLLKLHPPCYFDPKANQVGEIEQPFPGPFAKSLLYMPLISEAQLPWVHQQLHTRLREHAGDSNQSNSTSLPALPISIEHSEQITEPPKPVLRLEGPAPEYPELPARLLFCIDYQGVRLSPYEASDVVQVVHEEKPRRIFREPELEQEALHQLLSLATEQESKRYRYPGMPCYLVLKTDWLWYRFISDKLPELQAAGWIIEISDDFPYQYLEHQNQWQAELDDHESIDNPFFALGLTLEIGGEQLPAFPILRSALESLPKKVLQGASDYSLPLYIPLGNGKFTTLHYDSIKPLIRQFVELMAPDTLDELGRLKLSRYQSHHLLDVLDIQHIPLNGGEQCRQMAERLREFSALKAVSPPSTLQATLRPYQQQGLSWLQFLREYQLGGILADDMGLGKTLQTLAHLLTEKQAGRMSKPALIVAPTSVVFNWRAEAQRFAPELNICLHHGPARCKTSDEFQQQITDTDLVITSYALLARDSELLAEQSLYYLVLDESQTIKNPKTRLYEALLGIKAEHRLCLSGTPLQNNVGDIWSHFNFLLPGFLGSHRVFNQLYRTPIEKHGDVERSEQLNARLQPFILRRTKEKIARELPPKTEIIQKVHLEGKQAQLYESVRLAMDKRLKKVIADKGLKRSQIEILDALLKLRQTCCHPALLPSKLAKSVHQSAKLELLMEMLPELINEGRKVLLFSQFTSMLALIEKALEQAGITYLKLTGSSTNRGQLVLDFQNGKAPVFLISLKAGGVGLNLVEADTVIHFDPWWNPAVENQATDRAHRIGQDKPVFVYKLIAEGSIEETIVELQSKKQDLADALLSEEYSGDPGGQKLGLDPEQLQSLLAPLV